MFCPQCGSGQPEGSAFCATCGINLSPGGVALVPANPQGLVAPPMMQRPQMPPPPGYAVPGPRVGNPLALTGFICGLFGLTPFWIGFILCILAIVFSAIGMSKASRLGGVGKGFAIAGLVMGIVFLTPAACGI